MLDDEPYRQTDHLFALQTHGIDLALAGRSGTFVEAVLGGADRLQFHRWAATGILQLGGDRPGYGGALAYANQKAAPFTLAADAMALRYHDTWPTPPSLMSPAPRELGPFLLEKTLLEGHLTVARDFWGAPAKAGFVAVDDEQPDEPTLLVKRRRVAGPFVSATYAGVESTPYTGVRRALVLAPSLELFPGAWNSAGAMLTDARMEADVVLPLPLSRRHTLTVDLVGRDLGGLPAGARWLQVGGGLTAVSRRPDVAPPPEVKIDALPDVVFQESLRGYEDYPIATDRIFIAEAAYRYPLIVDRGPLSVLWVLPSAFLSQIDLELFGSAATDGHGGPAHAAGGGAVTLELAIWRLPLSLTYQVARRVEDDRALVQLVAVKAQ